MLGTIAKWVGLPAEAAAFAWFLAVSDVVSASLIAAIGTLINTALLLGNRLLERRHREQIRKLRVDLRDARDQIDELSSTVTARRRAVRPGTVVLPDPRKKT